MLNANKPPSTAQLDCLLKIVSSSQDMYGGEAGTEASEGNFDLLTEPCTWHISISGNFKGCRNLDLL